VSGLEAVLSLVMVLGMVGILLPVLPGSALIFAAVLVWSLQIDTTAGWVVLVAATVFLGVGAIVKFVLPGRRLKVAGIPPSTQWCGVAVGIVGFFVVPIVGLVLGFVGGVYIAERRRVGPDQAWPSTKSALRAVGLSIVIELVAATLAVSTWAVGVATT